MFEKYRKRFDRRRLVLIAALALVGLYVGWRTGGFQEQQPEQKPCVEGRNEIKDKDGKVVQVTRTTCFEDAKK
ncbi:MULTISPECIES: hypothetical protein [unclassified Sphingomonas]|uniref:hypothetical protein n=1 Tax=unclassified Sphingomonas TaxID=196159 RepID=UPI002150B458|nr:MULTISPECIES: hypothetical protein [unclassified Sphingomonas]MCR5872095.1 hypothetical protein [Sphingomonas sp. J344]UUX99593.1 hypothetical protein LRS08_19605 [Sphingomonas sp. J315]